MTKRKINWFVVIFVIGFVYGISVIVSYAMEKKAAVSVADPVTAGNFRTICLDGVLYWEQYRKLAVYIDKETLTPKRCEVAQ